MPGLALGMGLAMLPGLLSPIAFAADRDDPLGSSDAEGRALSRRVAADGEGKPQGRSCGG
ncbi:hypothetical protein [Streptomyces hawaiiensis]|uniref:hypothetical protein n=1 Tax=Streptomyces hawaiiensis TaxID=67305 RepID=UPI00364AB1A0